MKKVLISGIGLISVLGQTIMEHKDSLKMGKKALKSRADGSFDQLVNHVSVDNPKAYIKNKKAMRFYGLDTILGCVATSLALKDAEIESEMLEQMGHEVGLILGGSYIPSQLDIGLTLNNCLTNENEIDYKLLGERGMRELPPLWMLSRLPNTTAGQISIENGISGINFTIVNGMNSGIVSIGEAFHAIRQNRATKVVCGGVDVRIHPEYLNELMQKKMVANGAEESIPFGVNSKGYTFSEGACILILENKDENAKLDNLYYAEVIGYCNQYVPNLYSVKEDELTNYFIQCMETAILDANIAEKDVDFIQASACGYGILDSAEARAIREIFTNSVLVTSSQNYLGYTRAASGAFSTAIACLTLQEGCVYPILSQDELYFEKDITYVKEKPVNRDVNICIVNAFSYLGELCTLVLRKS